jgi:hypothetical protein
VQTKAGGLKVRARRGTRAGQQADAQRDFTPARRTEPPKGLDYRARRARPVRATADVFTRGAIIGDRAEVVVEIASARSFTTPWSGGQTCR